MVRVQVRLSVFNKDRLFWLRWAGPDCTVSVFSDDWSKVLAVAGGNL